MTPPANSRPRLGFTLVELLVVIAVIGILVALLLPAVQQAREAARQTQCKNNLKQIGLALHNYHITHKAFPPTLVVNFDASGPWPTGWWAWFVRVLPYLEQGPLYSQIDLSDDAILHLSTYKPQISQNIPTFLCPSDPYSERIWSTDTWWQGPVAAAHTNYLGCRGSTTDLPGNGVFPDVNLSLPIRDITDGLSHTLHAGERPVDEVGEWGWWAVGTGIDNHGTADHVLDCSEGLRPGVLGSSADLLHFWSPHPGGAYFLFCDGSVQFLPYTIDHNTFLGLGSRNGGEIDGDF